MNPSGNVSQAAQALHGVYGMLECFITLVIHTKDMNSMERE